MECWQREHFNCLMCIFSTFSLRVSTSGYLKSQAFLEVGDITKAFIVSTSLKRLTFSIRTSILKRHDKRTKHLSKTERIVSVMCWTSITSYVQILMKLELWRKIIFLSSFIILVFLLTTSNVASWWSISTGHNPTRTKRYGVYLAINK